MLSLFQAHLQHDERSGILHAEQTEKCRQRETSQKGNS